MGIGVSFFTEAVGAGPRKHMDMLGLAMNDGASLRISPTGTAQLAISVQTQGQGHETTFAQIVAHELGSRRRRRRGRPRRHRHDAVRARHLRVALDAGERRRDGDRGAQGPRPRAARRRARCSRSRPRTWSGRDGRWAVKGDPSRRRLDLREIAPAARGSVELPAGRRGRPRRRGRLRPAEPDVPVRRLRLRRRRRPRHGAVKVRRFIAVDDCGVRINPMIVEGQIHGGLTDGVGMALMEHDRVRRGRQLPRRVADGLPDPDRGRGPGLGDRISPSRRRRTTRSAPRASANPPPSARRRRSSTRSATRSASATSTCRAHRPASGRR